MCGCTYADQQSRDGRAVLIMDHGQQAGQVTLSGSRETQPAGKHVTQPIRRQNKAAPERDGAGRAEGLTWRRWTGSRWFPRRWTEPRRSAWWRRTFPATSPRTSEQQNNGQTHWCAQPWSTLQHALQVLHVGFNGRHFLYCFIWKCFGLMNHSMSETCYLFKFDYSAFHLICLCSAVWTSVVVLKMSVGRDFLKDLSQNWLSFYFGLVSVSDKEDSGFISRPVRTTPEGISLNSMCIVWFI